MSKRKRRPRHTPKPKPKPKPGPTPSPNPNPSPGQIAVGPRPPDNFHPVTISDINNNLVKHTYVQITGTIAQAHDETDGDYHLHVLDNSIPASVSQVTFLCGAFAVPVGSLVCEVVPEQPIPSPAIGSKVVIKGTLRFDLTHNWAEIHPVASIEPAP